MWAAFVGCIGVLPRCFEAASGKANLMKMGAMMSLGISMLRGYLGLKVPLLLSLLTMLAMAGPSHAQTASVVLRDDFDTAATLDQNNPNRLWTVYNAGYAYGRTQFGNQPDLMSETINGVETKFARLKLSTYNYNADRNYPLKGTEMYSQLFSLESGKELEARVRGNYLPPGLVSAFWTYGSKGTYGTRTYSHDEIDFEFLSNWRPDELLLTTWNDWNSRYGYGDGIHHGDARIIVPGLDNNQWNVYKIRWLNDRVEWFVNDVWVHSSAAPHPDDPLTVRFNIWAPDSSWTEAYSPNLTGTTDPNAGATYSFDVDYVEVRSLGAVAGERGTGLTATYFDNKDFSGAQAGRVDPQVNFDWGSGSPDPTIGPDTFSVRWEGQVQAKYNETYTFYTRTSDGVRLWVNNQLLIDKWRNQNATEYRGTIALEAGKKYDIKMEYYENTGTAVAELRWGSRSTLREIIPQARLYPATSVTVTSLGQ